MRALSETVLNLFLQTADEAEVTTMPLSHRDNYLRAATFQRPQWIPCSVLISPASWIELREAAEEVALRHPRLFPGFRKGSVDFDNLPIPPYERVGVRHRDAWGCIWQTHIEGLTGEVINSPLADWDDLAAFPQPDPLTSNDQNNPPDWNTLAHRMQEARQKGQVASGGLPHGWFLMRLWYLRGFENLMHDIALGEPRLDELIDRLYRYASARVDRWLEAGPDVMYFPEDLGSQTSSLISPRHFRRYVLPTYQELMQRCHDRGVLVHMHSDGNLIRIADELLEAGVDIINPQDLCNGIGELKRVFKGRVAMELDIDRQSVIPFGTRRQVRELIEEEVRELGSPEGGLMMVAGIYPSTPPEQIDALCEAMEATMDYWHDK